MNRPLILEPYRQYSLWGGKRLAEICGKKSGSRPLAETWECSTHPDGQSRSRDTGELLGDILALHPEYLGSHALRLTDGKAELPILVKLIDAREDLSVQVHPDDAYARRVEGDNGKIEMWYILAADPHSEIVYGFNQEMNREKVLCMLELDQIGKYLNHVKVSPDDVFMIEPGLVHAIGAGCLVAEIQESSNVTYRLYDYHRKDGHGRERELHIQKALDVMDLGSSISPRQPMRTLRYRKGCAAELLAQCRYFRTERLLFNTEIHGEPILVKTGKDSFQVLLVASGSGRLYGEGTDLSFFRGDCIFVPAESIYMEMTGKGQLLRVSC